MGYVIAGILVVLIVSGFVAFLVLNSTKKGGPDPKEGPPGIGPDEGTPLGDTTQHAGEQTREGATARDPEREEPARRGGTAAGGEGGVGGEAEGGRPVVPESEKLSNRPR